MSETAIFANGRKRAFEKDTSKCSSPARATVDYKSRRGKSIVLTVTEALLGSAEQQDFLPQQGIGTDGIVLPT